MTRCDLSWMASDQRRTNAPWSSCCPPTTLPSRCGFKRVIPPHPELTNWERPWRKYGGDNPTTTYLSAPVAADHTYRLQGSVGDAVYVGVQVYTKGPGYNAPSANISDTHLVRDHNSIDLAIGGKQPGGGGAWLSLTDDDYLVMVRLYHRAPELEPPTFTIERMDGPPVSGPSAADRARTAAAFFRDEILSTMAVTDTLRAAGTNAYPRPRRAGAPGHATPAHCFPRSTTSTTGSSSTLPRVSHSGSGARRRSPVTARSCSTTAGSTLPISPDTGATGPWMRSSSRQRAPTS